MTTTITLSAFLVTLVVGYLLPLGTALLTKLRASASVKQLITAVLSAVNGFIVTSTVQDGTAVFSKETLLFAILSFVTANVGYVYTFRPHGLDEKMAPHKGIG